MRCFCGCGRKVRFTMRPVNKRGAIIQGDVVLVRELLGRGLRSPKAEAFVRDGELICTKLAQAVHAGVDPGPAVEDGSRGFMAFSRQNFSEAALGASARRSGMPLEQAVVAMRNGDWDPFKDVEMPATPGEPDQHAFR